MKNDIKKIMLNEFERQIDEIFLVSSKKGFDFNKIITVINNQKDGWKLCRFDLKNRGNDFSRINILENFNESYIIFPSWFRDHFGQGCQIQGDAKNLNLKFQCVTDGSLRIILRGIDFKNLEHLRCPIYVNFTKFKLNDELIFDEDNLICHDEPYEFEISSNDKDIFHMYLEFETIYDYYPAFLNLFNNVSNMGELINEYDLFKKYVHFIRFLEQYSEVNESSRDMYDFMKNDNRVILDSNDENLLSYASFSNQYSNYLNFLEITDKFDQLTSKIKSLEDKMKDYESIIESDNSLFSTIFLDYTLKPTRLLYNVQTLCLELLSFVNKICEKYDIKWWLDFGTLLGSIRHENFIPWDDDIDIGIMRNDYHKFIGVMFDEIEKNNLTDYIDVVYRWRRHEGKEVNGSLHFFIRDEKVGKNIILAAVDFAPYDFMKDYDSNTFGVEYNRSLRKFYQMLCRGDDTSTLYMGLDYSEIIDPYYQELNLTYDKDKYIIPGVEGAFGYAGTNLYELIVLGYSDIFPLKESKFREYTFPVPNNSDFHLKQIYGENYMGIPKDIRTHNRLTLFRNVPNINELLESYIHILKEANKNFKY